MPAPIPQKLPPVTGRGKISKGFRISFTAINQIIDYLNSIRPKGSDTIEITHSGVGVSFSKRKKAGEGTGTSRGGESRWA